jgi:hypothetical protein
MSLSETRMFDDPTPIPAAPADSRKRGRAADQGAETEMNARVKRARAHVQEAEERKEPASASSTAAKPRTLDELTPEQKVLFSKVIDLLAKFYSSITQRLTSSRV